MSRGFLPAVLLLFHLFLAPFIVIGAGASAIPDRVTLSWTADPSTTITVTWRTDIAVTSSYIQYDTGTELTTETKTVTAITRVNSIDANKSRLFFVKLTDLNVNTQYVYRVGAGNKWSNVYTFTTEDPETLSYKFLVFGDSQSVPPYSTWRKTVQEAYNMHSDARFMVCTGDLVDTGSSNSQWSAWFDAAAGVVDTIPVMPVLGNHEYYGGNSAGKAAYWNNIFNLPQNGPDGINGKAYSFDYGQVHFVVLDSQANLSQQKKWLDDDLAKSKAVWKIIFFHKPPYDLRNGNENSGVKSAFCPIIDKHHVDVVFSGHDHGVARTYPISNGAIRQKPSQGTIYYVTGRSGTKTYKDINKRSVHAFFYNPTGQANYITVDIEEKLLTINTIKQDGTLIDSFYIDKDTDTCGKDE